MLLYVEKKKMLRGRDKIDNFITTEKAISEIQLLSTTHRGTKSGQDQNSLGIQHQALFGGASSPADFIFGGEFHG